MSGRKKAQSVTYTILALFICFIMLIPVYLLAKTSLSTSEEVLVQHPTLLIHQVTFEHWKDIFSSGKLWAPLIRSVVSASVTTLLCLIIVVPACYTVSHFNKKNQYIFIMTLFFTRMVPSVAVALPISVSFIKLGLLDTIPGLILANLICQIPFMAWILVSTFTGIPYELEEAAMVDGGNKIQVVIRVILPLAKQGIAVAAMYVFLNAWNEFTYALYLCNTTKTLPLQIYYYVNRGGFFEQATYSTILAIPVIIITFILQKYLKSDYLAGAVKG